MSGLAEHHFSVSCFCDVSASVFLKASMSHVDHTITRSLFWTTRMSHGQKSGSSTNVLFQIHWSCWEKYQCDGCNSVKQLRWTVWMSSDSRDGWCEVCNTCQETASLRHNLEKTFHSTRGHCEDVDLAFSISVKSSSSFVPSAPPTFSLTFCKEKTKQTH